MSRLPPGWQKSPIGSSSKHIRTAFHAVEEERAVEMVHFVLGDDRLESLQSPLQLLPILIQRPEPQAR